MLPALHRQAQILLPLEFRNYQAKAAQENPKIETAEKLWNQMHKRQPHAAIPPWRPLAHLPVPGRLAPAPRAGDDGRSNPKNLRKFQLRRLPPSPLHLVGVFHILWACSAFCGRVQHFVGVFQHVWSPPHPRTHLPQLLQDPQTPSPLDRGCSTQASSVFLKSGTLKCARLEFSGCRVKPRNFGLPTPSGPHPIGKRLSMGRNKKWVLEDNLSEAVWRTIFRGPVHHRSHCNVGRGKAPQPPQRGVQEATNSARLPLTSSPPPRLSPRLPHRLSPSFCLFSFSERVGPRRVGAPKGCPKFGAFCGFIQTKSVVSG